MKFKRHSKAEFRECRAPQRDRPMSDERPVLCEEEAKRVLLTAAALQGTFVSALHEYPSTFRDGETIVARGYCVYRGATAPRAIFDDPKGVLCWLYEQPTIAHRVLVGLYDGRLVPVGRIDRGLGA